MYLRSILLKKGYAKGSLGCNPMPADYEGRISKFDKNVVRPFLDDLHDLFKDSKLCVDGDKNGNYIIQSFVNFRPYSSIEVDIMNVEEKIFDPTPLDDAFLIKLRNVFEEHMLCIEVNVDGSLVLTNYQGFNHYKDLKFNPETEKVV